MARREYTESPYKYGDAKYGFAQGQTRNGIEEFVMPVALWEKDTASGLYMPPGESTNPKRPRVSVDGQVTLNGSNIKQSVVTTTPLNAGFSYQQTAQNAETSEVAAVGLIAHCDGLITAELHISPDGVTWRTVFYATSKPALGPVIIPPIPIRGQQWRWKITNPGASAHTYTYVWEERYKQPHRSPYVLEACLAWDIPIRDTSEHYFGSDPSTMFSVVTEAVGNGPKPLALYNPMDQAVSVRIATITENNAGFSVGTETVAAGANKILTNAEYPSLDVPIRGWFLAVSATVAPTTGGFRASMSMTVG